eukprot:GFUD01033661.1.p1 GENE.GFUD01033661.1~~GFUD01033661.1.p1  ORF type:complete len:188 (+),score=42.73 GFUD01033661.1:98-661(+)
MMKQRQPSGDDTASTSSSGYYSNVQNIFEEALGESEALRILSLNKNNGFPLLECRNSSRGCQVKSYSRVLTLHEDFCKFPKVRGLRVKSSLNLLRADKNRFRVFCESFHKSRQILFLFKMTKDCSSIKICAQNYDNKSCLYTLTLYDKKNRHIHKISGETGMEIHTIPSRVFREVGSLVKYKLQISN